MKHPCPGCSGNGALRILGGGTIPCRVCKKTGEVDDAGLERWVLGQALRDKRVAICLPLREAAKRVGMSPLELAEVERGIRGGAAEIAKRLEGAKG